MPRCSYLLLGERPYSSSSADFRILILMKRFKVFSSAESSSLPIKIAPCASYNSSLFPLFLFCLSILTVRAYLCNLSKSSCRLSNKTELWAKSRLCERINVLTSKYCSVYSAVLLSNLLMTCYFRQFLPVLKQAQNSRNTFIRVVCIITWNVLSFTDLLSKR